MAVTGGELVARTLTAWGVEVAFGLHGGHLDALLVALHRHGVRLVDVRHEAVAVNAADGYARTTGRLGVAFATAGSGFSNAVAGLGPAHADRSPVLLLTSSPPRRDAGTNALQGAVDQVAVATPVTRWAHRVGAIGEIPRLVSLAVRTALTGVPGPVVLDLPIDVLFGTVAESALDDGFPGDGARLPHPPAPSPAAVTEALEVLRAAERPVIVAGGGLRGRAPAPDLVALAEHTGVPVFHPGMIIGAMPGDHRLNAFGTRHLAALDPDAVLLLGTRFGLYLGGRGDAMVPRAARVVEVDVDGAEIGRLRPVSVGITADTGLATAALLAGARELTWPDRSAWAATVTGVSRRRPAEADAPVDVDGRMHPYHALAAVARAADDDLTWVVDGGELSHWSAMSLPEAAPRRGMGCGYLGHLGMTVGLAIGAAVADPSRRVVLVVGDGGAGFHPQEFDTMVRHRLPILTVVVNNESWGMSLHGQEILYGRDAGVVSHLADTDYDAVARGFGAAGSRVTRVEDVPAAVRAALDADGPTCLNLAVARDVAHPVTAAMVGAIGAGTVLPYYDNLPGDRT